MTQATQETPLTEERKSQIAAAQARAKHNDGVRERTKRVYSELRSPDFGLSEFGASILTVHIFHTLGDDAEKLSAKDAKAWAMAFRFQNPVCWAALVRGHPTQFIAALRRSGIATAKEEVFSTMGSIIRCS
jgi:hypothetical protein